METLLRKLQSCDAVCEGVAMGVLALTTLAIMVLSIAQM